MQCTTHAQLIVIVINKFVVETQRIRKVSKMTAFLVMIPILMFGLSTINLLLTIQNLQDSRRIESLKSQRSKLENYSKLLVKSAREYIDSQINYIRYRSQLEKDKLHDNAITPERSSYVYHLKDKMISNKLDLRVNIEVMSIGLTSSDYPDTQKLLFELITDLQEYSSQWDNTLYTRVNEADLEQYSDGVDERIKEMINLISQTQDQLTHKIRETNLYMDIMKRFKRKAINPIIEPLFEPFEIPSFEDIQNKFKIHKKNRK